MFNSNNQVYVIAEAGVNHNGDLIRALEMISIAKDAGADAIKFQTAVPEDVVTRSASKAEYQKNPNDNGQTQLDMIKEIHLPLSDYKTLKYECDACGIEFMSSAFDLKSLKYLKDLGQNFFKVPSGEINNYPYLYAVGKISKPVILSTGMSTLVEVNQGIDVLLEAGLTKELITLLHCNTEYPTPIEDVNLNAMLTLRDEFNLSVGYSDHTLGQEVSIAAVAMGAKVIEKHFTLDKELPGPDHRASLGPNELSNFVIAIRNIEKSLGSFVKKPSPSEFKNIEIVRRSIVAKESIKKGDLFTEDNVTTKRPALGISPMKWKEILGTKASKDYHLDDLIE
tara:strand:+ start:17493 stop:18506 length:1014 start_codon:yes stop_codon:yes gene_type:complete